MRTTMKLNPIMKANQQMRICPTGGLKPGREYTSHNMMDVKHFFLWSMGGKSHFFSVCKLLISCEKQQNRLFTLRKATTPKAAVIMIPKAPTLIFEAALVLGVDVLVPCLAEAEVVLQATVVSAVPPVVGLLPLELDFPLEAELPPEGEPPEIEKRVAEAIPIIWSGAGLPGQDIVGRSTSGDECKS